MLSTYTRPKYQIVGHSGGAGTWFVFGEGRNDREFYPTREAAIAAYETRKAALRERINTLTTQLREMEDSVWIG